MAIPKLKGWKPLGGSSRRWQGPKGQTVSRRQYENKVLKRKGWRNKAEAERFRHTPQYREAKAKLKYAKKGKRRRIDIFSDYAAYLRDVDWDLVEANWIEIRAEGRDRDMSADGKLAEQLELLGLREPEWEWDVGETAQGVTAIG